jgi:phospholipid:diacylglycerol acyltransferase
MLKYNIEMAVKKSNQKAALVSHSMGSNHMFYFLQWVTRGTADNPPEAGWVEKHIHSHVNIAGPMLGTPKSLTALLSGEMRDTAELSAFEPMLEQFFGRSKRKELFGTWGSLWTLMTKGGNWIWEYPLLTFTDSDTGNSTEVTGNDAGSVMMREFGMSPKRSTEEFLKLLVTWGGGYGPEIAKNLSMSFDSENGEVKDNHGHAIVKEDQYHNPLAAPLPEAPSMTHYCLYGVGLATEERYYYKKNAYIEDVPYVIDTSVNYASNQVRNGVKMGDGDATVPLRSMGYLCRRGWVDNSDLNPGNSSTVTVEYPNNGSIGSDLADPFRQGPKAADHVDIMGNAQLIEDVVKIVTGFGELESTIYSEIDAECDAIDARKKEKNGGHVKL